MIPPSSLLSADRFKIGPGLVSTRHEQFAHWFSVVTRHATKLTSDELLTLILRCEQRHSPILLHHAWRRNLIGANELAELIAIVWARAHAPLTLLPTATWREMFNSAGFTDCGVPAAPPERVRLYRGAPAEYRSQWYWTQDPAVATAFAFWHQSRDARVWTTVAPAASLLCHYREIRTPLVRRVGAALGSPDYTIGGPNFDEWAVDTSGLDIQPATHSQLCQDAERFGNHPLTLLREVLDVYANPGADEQMQRLRANCQTRTECCLRQHLPMDCEDTPV